MRTVLLRVPLLVVGMLALLPAAAPAPPYVEGQLQCAQTDSMTILLEWTIENVEEIQAVRLMRGVDPDENPIVFLDVEFPPESPGYYEDMDVWPDAWFRYYLCPVLNDGTVAFATDGICDVITQWTPVDASTWGVIKALYR